MARNVRQIRADPSALPDPIIDGILNHGELHILSGPFDSFKSTYALELASAVATGVPFLGRFPVQSPGGVFIYQQEVHPGVYDDRVTRLDINSHHQDRFWVEYEEFMFAGHGYTSQLKEIAKEKGIKLFIFDPLSNFWPKGMEENSNAWVSSVLKPLLHLRAEGISTLLVHGDAKATDTGSPVRARGASDLLYKPDARTFLDRMVDEEGDLLNSVRISLRTRNRERIPTFYASMTKDRRLTCEVKL